MGFTRRLSKEQADLILYEAEQWFLHKK